MNRDSLDYSKPTVQDVLSNKKYKIPKFQRPFAWDAEKAEQFYSDVFSSKLTTDYFLGSIVLNKNKETGNLEVIDGQQRLTTISLFIFALYIIYRQNVNQTDAEKYIHSYIKTGELNGEYSVLELSRHNNDFYQRLINCKSISEIEALTNDAKESNANIIKVLNLFISKINEGRLTDTDREKSRLSALLEYLKNNVFLIQLTVSDYSDASMLFEVLNNRGTELTEADIVRNYLLSEVEKFSKDSVHEIKMWELIEEKISLKNLERFLRYASFSFDKESDIYSRIRNYINKNSPKVTLQTLQSLADTFVFLDDPEKANSSLETELLEELNTIGIAQTRSVLLAAYSKYSTEDIHKLLRFLISFSLRFVVSGKNPNKLENKCSEISYEIFNGLTQVDSLIAKFKDPELLPTDEEFEVTFINKIYKSNSIPKYILSKIENNISSGEKIISPEAVHLEHIMPKKADKWFANGLSEETYKKYINNIGNMVILSKAINTQIKNSIFDTKKSKYDDSEISLMSEIKSKNNWSDSEIKENAKRYYGHAKLIWTI